MAILKDLPIDPELLRKRMMIPVKLAELSYIDEKAAIKYLRIWGEKKMAISELYEELIQVRGLGKAGLKLE